MDICCVQKSSRKGVGTCHYLMPLRNYPLSSLRILKHFMNGFSNWRQAAMSSSLDLLYWSFMTAEQGWDSSALQRQYPWSTEFGTAKDEKNDFWEIIFNVVENIPDPEMITVGGYMNGREMSVLTGMKKFSVNMAFETERCGWWDSIRIWITVWCYGNICGKYVLHKAKD